MNTYEIEVVMFRDHDGDIVNYVHSTIVTTDTEVPAGMVPDDVLRHAEMLRRIVGAGATANVGWHTPKNVSRPGSAETIWLSTTGPSPIIA